MSQRWRGKKAPKNKQYKLTNVDLKSFLCADALALCGQKTMQPLDGTNGFNCSPVTFVSVPTFHASSSSPYSLLENSFADISSPEIPSDASSGQEFINSAAADWAADSSGNNYINIADASNADLGDSGVVSNPFWVD